MRSNHGDLWVVKNAGGVSKWHVGLVGAGSVQVEPGTESLRWRRMQRAACRAGFPGRPGQLREVPTRDAAQRPALRRGRAVAGLARFLRVRFVGLSFFPPTSMRWK